MIKSFRKLATVNNITKRNTLAGPQLIQFIGFSTLNASGTSMSLPTGTQPGDLVFYITGSNATTAENTPTNFTLLYNNNSSSTRALIAYRTMPNPLPANVAGLTDRTDASRILLTYRHTDNSLDFPSIITSAVASTGMPNPPSIGVIAKESTVLALGFLDDAGVASTVAAPADYTLITAQEPTGATKVTVMAAHRFNAPLGTNDPGAFTATGGNDTSQAVTLFLIPIFY